MTDKTPEVEPGSAAALYGLEIATAAKHVVDELVELELIDDDLVIDDYAVACQVIAAALSRVRVEAIEECATAAERTGASGVIVSVIRALAKAPDALPAQGPGESGDA